MIDLSVYLPTDLSSYLANLRRLRRSGADAALRQRIIVKLALGARR